MTLDAVTEKIKSSNTASITWERDIGVSDFLQSITLPSDIHAIWDVSLINHTFLLERCPHAHRNAIVQSYQGAYNLQFWLNIALSRCTKPNDQTLLEDLRDNWQCPSDNQLDDLSQKMKNFFEASTLPDRKLYWKTLPFDPTDQNLNLKDNVTINRIIISPPFYNPIAADSLKDYMGVS